MNLNGNKVSFSSKLTGGVVQRHLQDDVGQTTLRSSPCNFDISGFDV